MENLFVRAVTHIFRTPFFKRILLIFLLISGALFLIQKEIVFPVFQKMQKASVESEAARTAHHLRNLLHIKNEPAELLLSEALKQDLLENMIEFQLIKVKIFDSAGLTVYSSEAKEIGEINTRDYFHGQVAKGKIFSKIVEENQTSMEGKTVPVSVAEVYVPILSNGHFQGAFEIYYNIIEQNRNIVRNELIFKIASFSTWFLLTLVFVSLLIRASWANILKTKAEEGLTETNHWLERTVAEKTREIKAIQEVSIQALAILAEHYDPDTGEHLRRIQLYVRFLLEYLSSSANQYTEYVQHHAGYIEAIVFASVLHDVGKTAIPLEILIKPEKLTPEEFEIVKNHTTIAGQALDSANLIFREEFGKDSYLALASDIAIYHHEKWNGEGYPHRLKGTDIPLSARITAIADVYDALTSERPYKKPWSHESAYAEIVKGSGSHFEPELVEAFKHCQEKFKEISENTARN
jgi:response regulator RpfG family c-di-GMP phosphodiesterase